MIARFCGLWVDESGRLMWIEADDEAARVTIAPGVGPPWFEGPPLLGRLRPSRTVDLPAVVVEEGRLRIEAGSPGLGPTYELVCEGSGLSPSVHLGLYDDFEDDLGVPWAFPLLMYRSATPAEIAHWAARR